MCSGYYCYITKYSNYSILFFSKTCRSGIWDGLSRAVLAWDLPSDCSNMELRHLKARLDWKSALAVSWEWAGAAGCSANTWPPQTDGPALQRGAPGSWTTCVVQGLGLQYKFKRNKAEAESPCLTYRWKSQQSRFSHILLIMSEWQAYLGTRWENNERNVKQFTIIFISCHSMLLIFLI